LVILGGPGDGEVVAASVDASAGAPGAWTLTGFLNDGIAPGVQVAGREVLGRLEHWRSLPAHVCFLASLHKVRKMRERAARIAGLGIPRERWANVIDVSARIQPASVRGVGCYVGPHAVVQPGATLGDHVSIRAGANLGHDVRIADYCYIGPNATLCGRSELQEGAHLAPNACVADGVRIGEYAVVGISSAVTKHVPAEVVVFGVPAKRVFAPAVARPGKA
jgi:sugar O-acyltransferase (sialic acid O-acetyltransferase NeuD family)